MTMMIVGVMNGSPWECLPIAILMQIPFFHVPRARATTIIMMMMVMMMMMMMIISSTKPFQSIFLLKISWGLQEVSCWKNGACITAPACHNIAGWFSHNIGDMGLKIS